MHMRLPKFLHLANIKVASSGDVYADHTNKTDKNNKYFLPLMLQEQ